MTDQLQCPRITPTTGVHVKRLKAGLAATLLISATAVAVLSGSPAYADTYCDKKLSVPVFGGNVAYVPGYGSTYKCSLYEGDSGAGVKTLQHAINYCYLSSSVFRKTYGISAQLVEDANFGPKTKAALEAVQKLERASGYTENIDGNYGPLTYNVMSFPGTGTSGPGDCWVPGYTNPW